MKKRNLVQSLEEGLVFWEYYCLPVFMSLWRAMEVELPGGDSLSSGPVFVGRKVSHMTSFSLPSAFSFSKHFNRKSMWSFGLLYTMPTVSACDENNILRHQSQ